MTGLALVDGEANEGEAGGGLAHRINSIVDHAINLNVHAFVVRDVLIIWWWSMECTMHGTYAQLYHTHKHAHKPPTPQNAPTRDRHDRDSWTWPAAARSPPWTWPTR